MENFDDIAAVWKNAGTPALPKASDIISKANTVKKKLAGKIRLQGITLLMTTAVIVYIAIAVPFKYSSTYIGLALMVICVSVFSVIRLRQVLFLKNADFNTPIDDMLLQFESFYKKQQWINTKGVAIYTTLLNIAFALYFYEVLAPASLLFKIIAIGLYLSWMLFAIFWLGKKMVKKEYDKTKAIIENLQQLKDRLYSH